MRCPSCGEYDVETCHHHYTTDSEEECTESCHSFCRNCDYGICE